MMVVIFSAVDGSFDAAMAAAAAAAPAAAAAVAALDAFRPN